MRTRSFYFVDFFRGDGKEKGKNMEKAHRRTFVSLSRVSLAWVDWDCWMCVKSFSTRSNVHIEWCCATKWKSFLSSNIVRRLLHTEWIRITHSPFNLSISIDSHVWMARNKIINPFSLFFCLPKTPIQALSPRVGCVNDVGKRKIHNFLCTNLSANTTQVCFATHAGEKRAKELIKYFFHANEESAIWCLGDSRKGNKFFPFSHCCAHRLHVLKTAVLFEELRFSHTKFRYKEVGGREKGTKKLV